MSKVATAFLMDTFTFRWSEAAREEIKSLIISVIEDISKAKIIEQECKFQMLSPSKKFNKIQLPVSQLFYTQAKEGGGGGRG